MDLLSPSDSATGLEAIFRAKYPELPDNQLYFLMKLPKSIVSRHNGIIHLAKTTLGCDYPDIFQKRIFGKADSKTLHLSFIHRGEYKKARFWIVLRLDEDAPMEMFHVVNNTTFKNLKLIEKMENRKLFMTERKPRLNDIFNHGKGWKQQDTNTDNMLYISYNKFEPEHVKAARPQMKRGQNYLFEVTLATSIDGDRMFVNIKDMLTKPLTNVQYHNITSLS